MRSFLISVVLAGFVILAVKVSHAWLNSSRIEAVVVSFQTLCVARPNGKRFGELATGETCEAAETLLARKLGPQLASPDVQRFATVILRYPMSSTGRMVTVHHEFRDADPALSYRVGQTVRILAHNELRGVVSLL
ncbi:MAG: hypothetical protein AAF909_01820 [Pseudomonadota bacterium]